MLVSRLLALSAVACAASIPAAAAQTAIAPIVPVTLYSYGYGPKVIRLAAGRPVTLRLTNRSGSGHDFTASKFFAASRIVAGNAAGGDVELRGGETKTVTLIPAAGTYDLHCGHPFHSLFGMRGRIIVQ